MQDKDLSSGLRRFFRRLTDLCFQQFLIENRLVAEYVSALLSRFARTSQLYRIRNAEGERLRYLIDLLGEARRALDPAEPRFSPFREREIRQHIGDYTLFMTGIFRGFVQRNASLQYYTDQGKISYSTVSEFDRLAAKAEATLFRELAEGFETYSLALDYMRRAYFKDPSVLGPYRAALRPLGEW